MTGTSNVGDDVSLIKNADAMLCVISVSSSLVKTKDKSSVLLHSSVGIIFFKHLLQRFPKLTINKIKYY